MTLSARRYSTAVHTLRLGVCLSVCLCVTSRCSVETAGLIDLELVFGTRV